MTQQASQANLFLQQVRDCLHREAQDARVIKIARHENVYTCGEEGDTIYYIESGQVKLVMVSSEGRECITAVHGAGEVFGELSLSGSGERIETATAMEDTDLKVIPAAKFFALLGRNALLEAFVRYLAARLADQQEVITQLATASSEHRLGTLLLELSRKLGKRCPDCLCLEHKITHEDLSKMVGTTRSRVSVFMKRFHNLRLIEMSPEHHLIVREKALSGYLTEDGKR